jgi:hypothetical protein
MISSFLAGELTDLYTIFTFAKKNAHFLCYTYFDVELFVIAR